MYKIKCENISHQYGNIKAVIDVSWGIKRGEFWGIIGPNGSGKSTLLRALSGTLKPSFGSVFLDNIDIYRKRIKDVAKEISFVPQTNNLSLTFTCREIVGMGRYPHLNFLGFEKKKDGFIIDEVMNLTRTAYLKDRFVCGLSGGEQQRILIAQALCQTRNILILDEPTSHLDINYQLEILDLLKKINNEENTTILVSLHDLNLASAYCDKLLMLKSGRVFAEGTPPDVISTTIIQDVYKVNAEVNINPSTKKLHVIPLSPYLSKKAGSSN